MTSAPWCRQWCLTDPHEPSHICHPWSVDAATTITSVEMRPTHADVRGARLMLACRAIGGACPALLCFETDRPLLGAFVVVVGVLLPVVLWWRCRRVRVVVEPDQLMIVNAFHTHRISREDIRAIRLTPSDSAKPQYLEIETDSDESIRCAASMPGLGHLRPRTRADLASFKSELDRWLDQPRVGDPHRMR